MPRCPACWLLPLAPLLPPQRPRNRLLQAELKLDDKGQPESKDYAFSLWLPEEAQVGGHMGWPAPLLA